MDPSDWRILFTEFRLSLPAVRPSMVSSLLPENINKFMGSAGLKELSVSSHAYERSTVREENWDGLRKGWRNQERRDNEGREAKWGLWFIKHTGCSRPPLPCSDYTIFSKTYATNSTCLCQEKSLLAGEEFDREGQETIGMWGHGKSVTWTNLILNIDQKSVTMT